jgi:hypothetical protein
LLRFARNDGAGSFNLIRWDRPEAGAYKGFCEKVLAAGCAGYIVSLAGRRAVYFGRTAETHVELFPSTK